MRFSTDTQSWQHRYVIHGLEKKQGEFSKSETELENYTYTLRLHFKAALKWYLSIICIVL